MPLDSPDALLVVAVLVVVLIALDRFYARLAAR